MLRLVVDEDLPRSLAPALRAAGYAAVDVRDEGLEFTRARVTQLLDLTLFAPDIQEVLVAETADACDWERRR